MVNITLLPLMKTIRKFLLFISIDRSLSSFRNLFADDAKSKDSKTPEPPFTADDGDKKDGGSKGRHSRGNSIRSNKTKTKKSMLF